MQIRIFYSVDMERRTGEEEILSVLLMRMVNFERVIGTASS